MSIADLMQSMADAGAPMEAIVIAVRAIEAKEAELAQGRAKEAERTRRYRERGGGAIPEQMRQEVFARDNHECVDCGSADYLQCDHIHPVSKGGETSLDNLQTLCRVCNARKKDRVRKQSVRGNSADIAGSSEDNPGQPPILDKESSPQTPFKEINPTPVCVSRARKAEFPRPDFADPQHWSDFLENRKRKRLPNTSTAHAKLLRDIEKYADDEWPPGRIIEHAAASGWAGIYDPRPKDAPNGHGRYKSPDIGKTTIAANRVLERIAAYRDEAGTA